jgi:cell wall-associated NlpC family hydrolase
MKRKAALAIIAAMLATGGAGTFPPLAENAYAASYVLSVGSYGEAVYALQTDLKELGYFRYPSVTGYYGTVTRDAVTAFQRDYGLAADGAAGPVTVETVRHAVVKKRLVQDTYSYIGTRYAWGGSDPSTGFDCSGFVYFMFTKFGVPQTRTTSAKLFTQGTPVERSMLRTGDLVFFKNPSTGLIFHVGFYMGDGTFISALSSKGIYVQSLDNPYWAPRYAGAKRVY